MRPDDEDRYCITCHHDLDDHSTFGCMMANCHCLKKGSQDD